MLVLSRRIGESIQIGDDVTITFVAIDSRGKVRLGVTAPRQVPVYRAELLETERHGGTVRHAPDCPAATNHVDDVLFPPGTFACTCGAVRKD